MKSLFSLYRCPKWSWRRAFESPRWLKGLLIRVPLIISGHLSTESCIAAYLFAKEVVRIQRHSGYLFTALYLKQCAACLQQHYSGDVVDSTQMSPYVSLTRSGLPRIIPSFHRRLIKDGVRPRSDNLVKMYLSWFTVARLVMEAPKVSSRTFSSITSQPTNWPRILVAVEQLRMITYSLLHRYVPWINTIPVNQGMCWTPTWKSLPNMVKREGSTLLPSGPQI